MTTQTEALKLALDKKADNARELGLDYEPENTLHWHALNYRTAPTQNAQAMFEALEKFVEAAIKEALAQPERHELQAKGEHPAPCARFCEANAFRIAERGYQHQIKELQAKLAQPEQRSAKTQQGVRHE